MKILSLTDNYLERALRNIGVQVFSYKRNMKLNPFERKKQFREFFTRVKPDIFFLTKKAPGPKDLKSLKDVHPPMKFVMWSGDIRRSPTKPVVIRRDIIDLLLVSNHGKSQHKLYRKLGIKNINVLYFAVCPDLVCHTPIPTLHDAIFGGSYYGPKKFPLGGFRIQFLSEARKKINLIVRGGGWPFPSEKRVFKYDYSVAIKQAKINIGINHFSLLRYYNHRIFNCMAAERLHLTHYIPGMEQDFENHKHLVWFKTIPEGLNLLDYYVKNDKARDKIATEGKKIVFEKHNWKNRATKLKALLERLLK